MNTFNGILVTGTMLFGFLLSGGCASNQTKEKDETALAAQYGPSSAAITAVDIDQEAVTLPTGIEASDYQIGPQDLLEIQVFGAEELSRTVRVSSRGVISLPLIGLVDAAGLTREELEAAIAAKLAKDYMQDPHVNIFIKEYTSQRITIEGAVNRPGVYPLTGQTSLIQAIAMAGGLGSLSNPNEVGVFRIDPNGKKKLQVFDLADIRTGQAEDPLVRNDDIVIVDRSKGRSLLRDSVFRDVVDFLNPFSRAMGGF